jgi:replicative DNA helicase
MTENDAFPAETMNERDIYDLGAERAFLACLMNNPVFVPMAVIKVKADDMYGSQNAVIYRAILYLYAKAAKNGYKMKYDASSMISAMKDMKCLANFTKEVGGLEYLSNIQIAPSDPGSFEFYMDTVLNRSARVKMFRRALDFQRRSVEDMSSDAFELVSELNKGMAEISDRYCKSSSIIKLGDAVPNMLDEFKRAKTNPAVSGVRATFMPKFMSILHGFRRRQFIILFARPKVGKSALLLNIGIDVALQNIPVLYIDTEMSADEQVSRGLSKCSGIREWDLMDGIYLEDEGKTRTIEEISKIFMEAPMYYTPARGISTDEIIAKMREFKERHVGTEIIDGREKTKPCLILYDWLKVSDKDSLNNIKEYQELGYIATKINDAISELDVPIICGAQANRFGNDKGVGIKSATHAQNFLADSDRLLRFCTCLAWLRRLNVEEQEIANTLPPERYFNQMLHIVDQRKGPTCMEGICLQYIGEKITYKEVEYTNLEEYNVDEATGNGGAAAAPTATAGGEQQDPFEKC